MIIPVVFAAIVVISSIQDLKFHGRQTASLPPESLSSEQKFSYDQHYVLTAKPRYMVEIRNDEGQAATLLWMATPYEKLWVLDPRQSENWSEKQDFQGRLVRCIYRCEINGMMIEIDEFNALLAKKFPDFAPPTSGKWPRIVLDVASEPKGIEHYFRLHARSFAGVGLSFAGGIIWVLAGVFRSRSRKKRHL